MEKKENYQIIFFIKKYLKTKSVQFLSANSTDPSRPAGKNILFLTGNSRVFTEYSLLDSPT